MARPAAADRSTSEYSPELIAYWLANWDLLVSLAESPRTSSHHLQLGHDDRHGSCHEEPRSRGGQPSDGLSWALVKADIEGAAAVLAVGSLERRVIYARTHGAGTLGEIARLLRTRKSVVVEAHQQGVRMIATALGWSPHA